MRGEEEGKKKERGGIFLFLLMGYIVAGLLLKVAWIWGQWDAGR